jgi:TRAP-type C4-dicarboxylate transport system permease large subunit
VTGVQTCALPIFCLFIVSAIGRVSVDKVTRAALPMIGICIAVLILVAFVPAISLTLPALFGR